VPTNRYSLLKTALQPYSYRTERQECNNFSEKVFRRFWSPILTSGLSLNLRSNGTKLMR
jgi:hypothetical protein